MIRFVYVLAFFNVIFKLSLNKEFTVTQLLL